MQIYATMLECKKKLLKEGRNLTSEQKNDFSLEVATRITLDLLLQKGEENPAKDLLFFIGCFPSGVYEE